MIFVTFAQHGFGEVDVLLRIVLLLIICGLGGVVIWLSITSGSGCRGISVRWGLVIPAGLVGVGVSVLPLFLEGALGSWVWLAAGAGVAALVLLLSTPFMRAVRRA